MQRKSFWIPANQFHFGQVAFTPSGTVAAPVFTGSALAGHAHDVLVKGGASGGIDEPIGVEGTDTLAKDAATDRTITGADSATKGGVIAGSAGTPAGTNSAPAFTGAAVAVDTLLKSAGAGNPLLAEISTFGLTGLKMSTDGDDARCLWPLPFDIDRRKDILLRILFASESATAADTILWKLLYKSLIPGTTVLAAPSTALNTIIASMTVAGVAFTQQVTSWGRITGGTLADTAAFLALLAEMDTKAAGHSEDIWFLGVHGLYEPTPDALLV